MNTDWIQIALLAVIVFQNTSLDEKLGLWIASLPRMIARLYRRVVKKSIY